MQKDCLHLFFFSFLYSLVRDITTKTCENDQCQKFTFSDVSNRVMMVKMTSLNPIKVVECPQLSILVFWPVTAVSAQFQNVHSYYLRESQILLVDVQVVF